jgi:hypothetical protein
LGRGVTASLTESEVTGSQEVRKDRTDQMLYCEALFQDRMRQ